MSESNPVMPPELAMSEPPFDAEFPLTDEAEHHPWRVTDDGSAEWAMRHLAALWAERQRVTHQAAAWMEPIQRWEEQQLAPIEKKVAFFRGHLERYGLAVRESSGDEIKSVSLPSGKIATRVSEQRPVVESEDLAVKWATETPGADALIETRQRIRAGELAKRVRVITHDDGTATVVDVDGEVVPGVVATPRTVSVTVTPGES